MFNIYECCSNIIARQYGVLINREKTVFEDVDIEDIHEIMKLSNIKSVISKREGGYEISLDKNNKDLINFIIPYTKKWFRIKDFFNGFSLRVKSAEEAKKILYETYDKYNRVSVSFNDLVSYLQKNRRCSSRAI